MPLGPADGNGSGTATITTDRVYVEGRGPDQHVRLAALDPVTGNVLWAVRDLGEALAATRPAEYGPVVVTIVQTAPGWTAYALDRATGAPAWQAALPSPSPTRYADDGVIAFDDPGTHQVYGLDAATGTRRWSVQHDATGILRIERPQGSDPSDHRLFLLDSSGTLREIDLRSGAVTHTYHDIGVPDGSGTPPTFDVIGTSLVTTVAPVMRVYDLTGVRSPLALNFTPARGQSVLAVVGCGATQLCLLTAGNTTVATTLAGFDVTTGAQRWAQSVPDAVAVTAGNDRLITDDGHIFDSVGTARGAVTADFTGYVGPSGALMLAADGDADDLLAVSTDDGSAVNLGRIPAPTGECAADARILVCPEADGFHLWSVAG
jgi:outer membrane protein assembly factor BamB